MSGHVSPPGLSIAGKDAGQGVPGPPAGFILPIFGNISLLLTGRGRKMTESNGHKDWRSRLIHIHELPVRFQETNLQTFREWKLSLSFKHIAITF